MRDDGRLQGVSSVNLLHRLEEVRRGDVRVHAVGVRAPRAVVTLLEQSTAVRPRSIAVVDDAESGLSHGRHDADGLVSDSQAEVLAGLDDVGGVDELFMLVARDGRVRHRVRVDADTALRPRLGVAGGRGRVVVPEQEDHAQDDGNESGGNTRGEQHPA